MDVLLRAVRWAQAINEAILIARQPAMSVTLEHPDGTATEMSNADALLLCEEEEGAEKEALIKCFKGGSDEETAGEETAFNEVVEQLNDTFKAIWDTAGENWGKAGVKARQHDFLGRFVERHGDITGGYLLDIEILMFQGVEPAVGDGWWQNRNAPKEVYEGACQPGALLERNIGVWGSGPEDTVAADSGPEDTVAADAKPKAAKKKAAPKPKILGFLSKQTKKQKAAEASIYCKCGTAWPRDRNGRRIGVCCDNCCV